MAIEVPDLTTLDVDEVDQAAEYIAQRLGEYAPTLQRRRGVVREILSDFNAILAAAASKVIEENVTQSSSLLAITENPEGADPDMVDRVISNFRITRRNGAKSEGQVAVVVSQLTPLTISKGMLFESGGAVFETGSAFAARTSAGTVVNATDRLLRPTGDGDYVFTIDVTAVEEGVAGQLKRGARLTPQSLIVNFVRSYAENDFANGTDADTNAALLARLEGGLADRSSSNRVTIASMIQNEPDFEQVVAVSTIGYGNFEQKRYHYLFPVAFGGRLDVYVRTQAFPQVLKLTKTCTLVDTVEDGGIWQFSLARDEAPGFYRVEKITVADDATAQAGYEVRELVRGFDLTEDGTGFLPDIETADEAAFSRFQTATVRFLDTDTDPSVLVVNEAQKDYDVYVSTPKLVAELQSFLSDESRRPGASDVLVKGAIPCYLELNFVINKKSGAEDPDLSAIRSALTDYVNALGFEPRLVASALTHIVHQNLPSGQTVGSIDMFANIVRPDGTLKYLRSDEVLLIPDESENMLSRRTVVFYLDIDMIGIAVRTE